MGIGNYYGGKARVGVNRCSLPLMGIGNHLGAREQQFVDLSLPLMGIGNTGRRCSRQSSPGSLPLMGIGNLGSPRLRERRRSISSLPLMGIGNLPAGAGAGALLGRPGVLITPHGDRKRRHSPKSWCG